MALTTAASSAIVALVRMYLSTGDDGAVEALASSSVTAVIL
jgi:hypothetical protein